MNAPDNRTAETVLKEMSERFTSLNAISVERASITRTEWKTLLTELRHTADMGFHGAHVKRPDCASCRVAIAIDKALEGLK